MTESTFVRVDEFRFTRVTYPGSNCIRWNVDLNGAPFGQLWTFRNTRTCTHRFHAQTLAGSYADFETYAEAETFIRGCA